MISGSRVRNSMVSGNLRLKNNQPITTMTTLTPAYGRDYKSKAAIQADIDANRDFILNNIMSPWDGKPVSPSDLKGETVQVRYAKLHKVAIFKL